MKEMVHPIKEDEKKKVQECLDVMLKAAEIADDEELMQKVSALAGNKKRAIRSIADIIARRERMNNSEDSAVKDDPEEEDEA